MLVAHFFEIFKILYVPELDFVIVPAGRYKSAVVANINILHGHIMLAHYA